MRSSITSRNSRPESVSGPSADLCRHRWSKHSRQLKKTLVACASDVTGRGCAQLVNRHRDTPGAPSDQQRQPAVVHTRWSKIRAASTTHPHPDTVPQQADDSMANRFNRPYYYYCFLTIDFPLKDNPWGNPAHTPADDARTPLRHLTIRFQDGPRRSTVVHQTAILGGRLRRDEGTPLTWQPPWLTPT